MISGPFSTSLPLLVFGVLAIIAGLTCLLIPEIGDKNLPDTFEDMKIQPRYSKKPTFYSTKLNS